MSQELWTAVDQYLNHTLVHPDAALEAAIRESESAELPAIAVTAPMGKFLHLMAKIQGAKNILEIGTLGGYSTIWLARALPAGGKVVTLEMEVKHAEVARANFVRAGVADRIDLRVAPALEMLPKLAAEGRGPFDFIFIDADKPNNPNYFAWSHKLSRPGTIIVIDNVIRKGEVIDAASADENVQGVRQMHDLIAAEPRVSATALQTVGDKGYDGFTLVRVID